MRPAFNFEPKYRVIMLTREDWTKETGIPPVVKGLVWFTDGSKMKGGTRSGVYGQSVGIYLQTIHVQCVYVCVIYLYT